MYNDIGRAAFNLAFYLVFVAGILLLFLPNGSAEQVIALFTFFLGLIFLAIVVVWVRWMQRKE